MHLFLYYRGFPKTCQYFHFVSRLPHDFFTTYGPSRQAGQRLPLIRFLPDGYADFFHRVTKKKHASLHPWEYAEREISMGRCSNRTSFSIERSRCRPKKEKDFSPS